MRLLEILSSNAYVGAFVAGISVAAIITLFAWAYRRTFRAKKVYLALKAGLVKHNCKFLPSSFLASETSYTIQEIEKLCTMHPKIKRNKRQLESWCLDDS